MNHLQSQDQMSFNNKQQNQSISHFINYPSGQEQQKQLKTRSGKSFDLPLQINSVASKGGSQTERGLRSEYDEKMIHLQSMMISNPSLQSVNNSSTLRDKRARNRTTILHNNTRDITGSIFDQTSLERTQAQSLASNTAVVSPFEAHKRAKSFNKSNGYLGGAYSKIDPMNFRAASNDIKNQLSYLQPEQRRMSHNNFEDGEVDEEDEDSFSFLADKGQPFSKTLDERREINSLSVNNQPHLYSVPINQNASHQPQRSNASAHHERTPTLSTTLIRNYQQYHQPHEQLGSTMQKSQMNQSSKELQSLQKYLNELSQNSNSYSVQKVFVKQFQERLQLLEKMTSKSFQLCSEYEKALSNLSSQQLREHQAQLEQEHEQAQHYYEIMQDLEERELHLEEEREYLRNRELEIEERVVQLEEREQALEKQIEQLKNLDQREQMIVMKQEELKQLKDSIYEKVIAKQQELDRITSELQEKEKSLKEFEDQLELRKIEMERVQQNMLDMEKQLQLGISMMDSRENDLRELAKIKKDLQEKAKELAKREKEVNLQAQGMKESQNKLVNNWQLYVQKNEQLKLFEQELQLQTKLLQDERASFELHQQLESQKLQQRFELELMQLQNEVINSASKMRASSRERSIGGDRRSIDIEEGINSLSQYAVGQVTDSESFILKAMHLPPDYLRRKRSSGSGSVSVSVGVGLTSREESQLQSLQQQIQNTQLLGQDFPKAFSLEKQLKEANIDADVSSHHLSTVELMKLELQQKANTIGELLQQLLQVEDDQEILDQPNRGNISPEDKLSNTFLTSNLVSQEKVITRTKEVENEKLQSQINPFMRMSQSLEISNITSFVQEEKQAPSQYLQNMELDQQNSAKMLANEENQIAENYDLKVQEEVKRILGLSGKYEDPLSASNFIEEEKRGNQRMEKESPTQSSGNADQYSYNQYMSGRREASSQGLGEDQEEVQMSFQQIANLMMEAEYRMNQSSLVAKNNDSSIMGIDRASIEEGEDDEGDSSDQLNCLRTSDQLQLEADDQRIISAEERKHMIEGRNQNRKRKRKDKQHALIDLEQQHFSFDKDKMQLYNVEEQQPSGSHTNLVQFTLESESSEYSSAAAQPVQEQRAPQQQPYPYYLPKSGNSQRQIDEFEEEDDEGWIPSSAHKIKIIESQLLQSSSASLLQNEQEDLSQNENDRVGEESKSQHMQRQRKSSTSSDMHSSNKKYLAQQNNDYSGYASNDSSSCLSDQNDDFALIYKQRQEEMIRELNKINEQKDQVKEKFFQLASEFENSSFDVQGRPNHSPKEGSGPNDDEEIKLQASELKRDIEARLQEQEEREDLQNEVLLAQIRQITMQIDQQQDVGQQTSESSKPPLPRKGKSQLFEMYNSL